MNARVELPDEVGENIAGQRAGERTVRAHVDGFAHPDRLLHDLIDVVEADGQSVRITPRLRGWTRAVSKFLESGTR